MPITMKTNTRLATRACSNEAKGNRYNVHTNLFLSRMTHQMWPRLLQVLHLTSKLRHIHKTHQMTLVFVKH